MPFHTLEDLLANTKEVQGPLDTPCRIWKGKAISDGYPYVWFNGQNARAHREVYQLVHDISLKSRECVCHRCDVPMCIEPSHLFVGSDADNQADRVVKNRLRASDVLNEEKVREIRRAHAKGASITSLAKKYGMSVTGMHHVVKRHTWNHIE